MNESIEWHIEHKNVLVTGSSRGIGFYTALGLAKKGAHLIIVSHNQDRIRDAATRINESVQKGSASYYVADLSSQGEVRRFADQIKSNYGHLDVLVNNVGGWFRKYKESEDGIEMTFALNHLSYFLLTGLLIDLLRKDQPGRIINVASDAHKGIDGIRFDDIQFKNFYRPYLTYAQSKLANIMFTYELAKRLEGSAITVNALHPGSVASELYRNFGILTPLINIFLKIFAKTSEEGAETPIYLASSPDVTGVTGKYFADKEQINSSEVSYQKGQWERLWQISEEMTGFQYPV
jgi:NAD(P)-dependent dehydrogenase (short-subunit alcohol dehydrogenase family)